MTETDPTRDAALAVIDDALASGRVTAAGSSERELQELALAIEAESPLPDEEFVRGLNARVADGFMRERRTRRAPSVPFLRGRALALTGAAASVVVVIGIALGITTQQEDTVTSDALTRAPEDSLAQPEPIDPAPNAARSSQPGGAIAPRERERRIERAAQLTLAAPGDELDSVADDIVRVTDRHRGFVLRSSVSTGDENAPGGLFELRIPADSLQAALRDLSRLGHVRARTQSGQDVTPAFVSVTDRLDAARAERRGLLRRLERATTDAEADAIRRRLDSVSLRIERLRRELGALRERTNYAAVTITLTQDGDDDGGAGTGGTGEALDDALGLLVGSLNLALRALGVLIPVGLATGLGWLGARSLRRRRREAALQ